MKIKAMLIVSGHFCTASLLTNVPDSLHRTICQLLGSYVQQYELRNYCVCPSNHSSAIITIQSY
eukprot:scaffold150411_cov35-Prasinocladus_malaysianus.AAC.1